MADNSNHRVTNTQKKHLDLYFNYKKVLARYGDKARQMPKIALCMEANEMPATGGFYYSDMDSVMKIIVKMLKLDREGRLPDLYPTKTVAIEGWGSDNPQGDWWQCMGCNYLYFKPDNLPNTEPMIFPNFCPCCGSFIRNEDDKEQYQGDNQGE